MPNYQKSLAPCFEYNTYKFLHLILKTTKNILFFHCAQDRSVGFTMGAGSGGSFPEAHWLCG